LETFEVIAGAIVGRVQAGGSNRLMMRSWMVFGKAVGFFVETALFPAPKELALAHAIANPTEAHANGFGALLFDIIVDDNSTSGSAVVRLDRCRRLRG
jgi:hypothetical protein